jgi:glutathione S-transferase
MKLYYSAGACSLAPHIVLQESGVKFAAEAVDLKTHQVSGSDFYKVNPKGSVPTLELDNGQILTEGAVIMQYIADQKPESGLMPKAGTMERYRAQEWLNYIATEIHKGFSPLWSDKTPETMKVIVKENLFKKFDFLNKRLTDSQFLTGSQFSAADAYLFTILNWTNFLKIDISKWSAFTAVMKRVTERPAVQTVLKAEGLLK